MNSKQYIYTHEWVNLLLCLWWHQRSTIVQDNVFVQIHCSIQYRIIKENADDAFYELQNPKEQIQAYVFDGNLTLSCIITFSLASHSWSFFFSFWSNYYDIFLFCPVVRAHVPKMNLDEVFVQKNDVAQAVSEELEKVTCFGFCFQ